MPADHERQQLDAARRMIEQTRRDRDALEKQIRNSKETIAKSEKMLARLDRRLARFRGQKTVALPGGTVTDAGARGVRRKRVGRLSGLPPADPAIFFILV
jgi:septal ring factor EnvC (AmiA/AmiB activator)